MKYVFVGDRPSPYNKDPKIAFLGTKSYVTLMHWIGQLQLHYSEIEIINKDDIPFYFGKKCRFIALGNDATDELSMWSKEWNLDFFKLPHPSGLNRKLNDKEFMRQELAKCREWISEN